MRSRYRTSPERRPRRSRARNSSTTLAPLIKRKSKANHSRYAVSLSASPIASRASPSLLPSVQSTQNAARATACAASSSARLTKRNRLSSALRRSSGVNAAAGGAARWARQHFLYFRPLPQGHGSFRPIGLMAGERTPALRRSPDESPLAGDAHHPAADGAGSVGASSPGEATRWRQASRSMADVGPPSPVGRPRWLCSAKTVHLLT